MAEKNEHILYGFLALIPTYFLLNYFGLFAGILPLNVLTIIFITYIYSILPDVDQPGSIINRVFYVIGGVVIIWAFYTNKTNIGILTAVMLVFFRLNTHRRFIHSVLVGIILSLPLLWLGVAYFFIGIIMYIVHLLVDREFSLFSGGGFF